MNRGKLRVLGDFETINRINSTLYPKVITLITGQLIVLLTIFRHFNHHKFKHLISRRSGKVFPLYGYLAWETKYVGIPTTNSKLLIC